MSKEIGKAWRKSLAREPHTPVAMACEARENWLLARTWIRKNTDCFAVYVDL